jgi:LmbE family N-acetylglucosaminyl deacetylase
MSQRSNVSMHPSDQPDLYAARATAAGAPPAFDPAAAGTSESEWARVLRHSQAWSPADGRLVVVSPHPDDEVLGAGGLMHSRSSRGLPVTVVSVTDGEAAYANAGALGAVRQVELRAALRKLSPSHIEVLRLGLPDGRVAEQRNKLRNALAALLTCADQIVAPYEEDGHPDHETVGSVCREVAKALGSGLVRYPIWRWHHGDVDGLKNAQWGSFALSPQARRAKQQAVQCFESQLRTPVGSPILPQQVLDYFARPYEAFLL